MGILLFDDFMVRTGLTGVLQRVVSRFLGCLCTHEVHPSTSHGPLLSLLVSSPLSCATAFSSCNEKRKRVFSDRMLTQMRKKNASYTRDDSLLGLSHSKKIPIFPSIGSKSCYQLLRVSLQCLKVVRRSADLLFTVSSGSPAVSIESLIGDASCLVFAAAFGEGLDISLAEKYSLHEWIYHSTDATTEKLLLRGIIRVNGANLTLSPNVPLYAL